MMDERRVMQEALFYGFSLERYVPDNHMLRKIDRSIDLSEVRAHLGPHSSDVGRPSIDPELMMRMLIVGYGFGIRSGRRLCDEVHLNLAYRWFCRLGLDGDVPDHSTFSKNRHGRFRESDLLRGGELCEGGHRGRRAYRAERASPSGLSAFARSSGVIAWRSSQSRPSAGPLPAGCIRRARPSRRRLD